MYSTFQMIEKLHTEIKITEELYKQCIQALGNEVKQGNTIAIKEESVINEPVQDPIVEIRKIKKQSTV
jgi:hypothetical protein